MIERNLNAAGRLGNIVFGVAQLADGMVRVLSLGFLHTRFPVTVSRWQAYRALELHKKGVDRV
jgi:hypothetical protein